MGDPMKTLLTLLVALLAAVQASAQTPANPKAKAPAAKAKSLDDQYVLTADSQEQSGVPKGEVTEFELKDSKAFPGYPRKWALYVPKQYDGSKPACLMVFQDGLGYSSRTGAWRVPTVFDNLIHKGEMPVTIGLFINPGFVPDAKNPKGKDAKGRPLGKSNRSFEYDSVTPLYAQFLIDEMIPMVEAKGYKISKDPARRAIAGASSGGICAFNAAWHRPDQFSKVFTTIGSFTKIRWNISGGKETGGDVYPDWVRQNPRKNIRVYQQEGSNDLLNEHGSWPEANRKMAAALKEKGYDHVYVEGEGTHNSKHGAMLLPQALRWLWRDVR